MNPVVVALLSLAVFIQLSYSQQQQQQFPAGQQWTGGNDDAWSNINDPSNGGWANNNGQNNGGWANNNGQPSAGWANNGQPNAGWANNGQPNGGWANNGQQQQNAGGFGNNVQGGVPAGAPSGPGAGSDRVFQMFGRLSDIFGNNNGGSGGPGLISRLGGIGQGAPLSQSGPGNGVPNVGGSNAASFGQNAAPNNNGNWGYGDGSNRAPPANGYGYGYGQVAPGGFGGPSNGNVRGYGGPNNGNVRGYGAPNNNVNGGNFGGPSNNNNNGGAQGNPNNFGVATSNWGDRGDRVDPLSHGISSFFGNLRNQAATPAGDQDDTPGTGAGAVGAGGNNNGQQR